MKKTDKKEKIGFFLELDNFLERYKKDLKSPKTVDTYNESLENFKKYLLDQKKMKLKDITFGTVTDDTIRDYLTFLKENNKSLNTRNTRLTAIHKYLEYCGEKHNEAVPLYMKSLRIHTKNVPAKKHNWITLEQIKLILDQCGRNKIGIRDRMIILFLFMTGARLAEMINCRLKDICMKGKSPYVVLNGKGSKPRLIPITDELYENLKYYISLFHRNNDPDCFLFYVNHKGHREEMSEDNVQRILNKYGNLAREIDTTLPSIHPHLLRHSFGAINYRAGMSQPELAKLMGHENIETTEIYAETDFEMVRNAVEKLNKDKPSESMWDKLSEEEKAKVTGKK